MNSLVTGLGLAAGIVGAGLGDPQAPVTVPQASELALRYYRSGNVIWVVEHLLALGSPRFVAVLGPVERACAPSQRDRPRAPLPDADRLPWRCSRCCCS